MNSQRRRNPLRKRTEPTCVSGNQARGAWLSSRYFRLLAIGLVVLIVYWPAVELGWIWDDDQYVTDNLLLRTVSGLRQIWLQPLATPQYYPVVFTGLWIEYQLFGLEPGWYHAVNVILHAATAILCFLVLDQLKLKAAWWISLAFALHPIQVESVAWITEIKNLLSGLLYFAAWLLIWPVLVSEPHGDRTNSARVSTVDQRYLIGLLCFLMALLSKSITATLPAAMLLLVWYRRGAISARAWTYTWPLLAIGMVAGWHTAWLERQHVGAFGQEWSHGMLARVGIAARSIVHYVAQLIFPVEQIFFYPRFSTSPVAISHVASLVGLLALLAVGLILARRGQRSLLTGSLFFVGTALPALGFVNVYPHRFSFVADHFVYLASLGILSLLVSIIWHLSLRLRTHLPANWKLLGLLPLPVLMGCYAWQVVNYLPVFTTSVTLWEDTLAKNPACPAALQNLGLAYHRSGRQVEAAAVLHQALDHDFDRFQTWNSLGLVLAAQGRNDESLAAFKTSVELNPENPLAWINLGNLLRAVAANGDADTRRRSAIDCYLRAWELSPEYRIAFGLGVLNFELDDFPAAVQWFEQSLLLRPEDRDAVYNLQQALRAQQAHASDSRDSEAPQQQPATSDACSTGNGF